MNKKLDIIIKLIITAAIIVTLFFIALPMLKSAGIIGSGEQPSAAGGFPGAPGGGFPGMPGGGPQGGEPAAQAVYAYVASIGTVSNYIKVNGDVVTDVEIEIYPDIAGKVIGIDTAVGAHVGKDEIIAKIDPSRPGQQYAASSVYSTISGTVLSVNVHAGDRVTTNSSIITVGDLNELKLVTYVPEKYIGTLRTGLPAEASFAAYPDRVYNVKISEISPVVDPSARTIEATLDIENYSNTVKAGMFASIKLVTEQVTGVITVPTTALTEYYGDETVFVIKDDNTVERRKVSIGLETIEMVEIKEGLSVGEAVVIEGQSLLKEGSLVRIVE